MQAAFAGAAYNALVGVEGAEALNVALAAEGILNRWGVTNMPSRQFPGTLGFRAKRRNTGQPQVPAGTVPNVVRGGNGHYMGQFRKTRIGARESAVTKYGFLREMETFGVLQNVDCQYLGVQNANTRMIVRPIAASIIRYIMYREFGLTYGQENELLFENTLNTGNNLPFLVRIDIIGRIKTSNGNSVTTVYPVSTITFSTKLSDVITALRDLMLTNGNALGFDSDNPGYIYGYQLRYQTGGTAQSVGPLVSLEKCRIHLSVRTVVNIQNVTAADNPNVPYTRDAIDANPLVGKCFTMKGRFPIVEDQAAGWVNSNFAAQLQSYSTGEALSGIIVPQLATTDQWVAIPNPQIFHNILKCESGLRLEPGEIKKDYLEFKYSGSLNDLIAGFRFTVPSTTGVPQEYTNDPNQMGIVKLYAFEKVVPVGVDIVKIQYHLDRYQRCVLEYVADPRSVHTNFRKITFSYQYSPPPVPGAVAAPINDEEIAEVQE